MNDKQFSPAELAKRKAIFAGIVFAVAVVCTAIIRLGKLA
jgi:hypothetical protein